MQRVLDNPFILLFIGIAVPTFTYIVWGIMELVALPIAPYRPEAPEPGAGIRGVRPGLTHSRGETTKISSLSPPMQEYGGRNR